MDPLEMCMWMLTFVKRKETKERAAEVEVGFRQCYTLHMASGLKQQHCVSEQQN